MTASIVSSGNKKNIQLQLTTEVFDAMHCGQKTDVTIKQEGLIALDESVECFEVMVQASRNNGEYIKVGNRAQGCFFELAAGDSITIPINNLNKVQVKAEAGTQTVYWIAMI